MLAGFTWHVDPAVAGPATTAMILLPCYNIYKAASNSLAVNGCGCCMQQERSVPARLSQPLSVLHATQCNAQFSSAGSRAKQISQASHIKMYTPASTAPHPLQERIQWT